MDQIEKLLRKIGPPDRQRLLGVVQKLLGRQWVGLDVKKVQHTDFYRVRSGRFRIIFHRQQSTRDIIIDSIQWRREDTYRKLKR